MLRHAEESDLLNMRFWRNQTTNREVSLHQHEISLDEHLAWWEGVSQDPTREVLVFEAEGEALGVVNFFDLDLEQRVGSWGFFLNTESDVVTTAGMLLWTRVMKEAISYAFDTLNLTILSGEVLAHNEAVRMMNRRYRFREGETMERQIGTDTVSVIPISLHRDDRRGQKPKDPSL